MFPTNIPEELDTHDILTKIFQQINENKIIYEKSIERISDMSPQGYPLTPITTTSPTTNNLLNSDTSLDTSSTVQAPQPINVTNTHQPITSRPSRSTRFSGKYTVFTSLNTDCPI